MKSPTAARFVKQTTGLTNAAGTCTLTFDPPPQGYTQTGAITVIGSPIGVTWTINLGGVPVDSTVGNGTAANIQCQGTDVITVVSTNLLPGTIVKASYIGIMDLEENVDFVSPSTDSVQSFVAGGARVVGIFKNIDLNNVSGTLVSFNLQPTERSVIIVANGQAGNSGTTSWDITYSVSGGITGVNYAGITLGRQNPAVNAGGLNFAALPIYGLIDPIGTLFVGATSEVGGSPAIITVTVIAVPDEITSGTTPGTPTFIQPPIYVDQYKVIGINNTTLAALASPATGFLWQIHDLIFSNPGASTMILSGHTTGTRIAEFMFPAANSFVLPGPIILSEGMDILNNGATAATLTFSYHNVPTNL